MSDLILLFIEWFLIGFTGAIVPGSVLVMIINVTGNQGWQSAELAIVGHAVLEMVFVVLLVLGLSPFLLLPEVQFWLPLLGGTVLVVLGSRAIIETLRSHKPSVLDEPSSLTTKNIVIPEDQKKPQKRSLPLALGIATSIANPYFVIWWATIGATFITRFLPYFPPVPFVILPTALLISVSHSSTDFIWYTVVIIGLVKGRQFLGARYYTFLVFVSGVIMAYLGATYLIQPLSSFITLASPF